MPQYFDELEPCQLCPCCGRLLDADRVLVDLNSNTVALGPRRWKATPHLAEFIDAIAKPAPRAVSYLAIGDALYGVLAPEGQQLRSRLAVFACQTRALLGSAATVEVAALRGYRLVTGGSPMRRP
jgi:hypothetical protein